MDDLRIAAEPANRDLPTVGPWFLTCSEHGPLGMATSALAVDTALLAHSRSHAHMVKGATS